MEYFELKSFQTLSLKVLQLDGVSERTMISCWPKWVQFSLGSRVSVEPWSGSSEWWPIELCSSPWISTCCINHKSRGSEVEGLYGFWLISTIPSSSIVLWFPLWIEMSLIILASVVGLPERECFCRKWDTGLPEAEKVSPPNLSQVASGETAVRVTPSFMPAPLRKTQNTTESK